MTLAVPWSVGIGGQARLTTFWPYCFSKYVPKPYTRLYGCLKMPEGVTAEAYSEAITKSTGVSLRKWEQKTGEILVVLLCPDIRQDKETREQRLHFDLIGCTSVSLDKAHDVIKGGNGAGRSSSTAMRTPEKAIRYFAKYQKPKRGEFRCLQARRDGLNNLYGMATLCKRFGTSAKELWIEQRRIWFGDDEMEKPTYQKALQHPRVIPKVSEIITSIVLSDPTREELQRRSD